MNLMCGFIEPIEVIGREACMCPLDNDLFLVVSATLFRYHMKILIILYKSR